MKCNGFFVSIYSTLCHVTWRPTILLHAAWMSSNHHIRQLQVSLDMYFTIPTFGNIQIREGIVMTHANVKILHNGVKSSVPTFMPLGHLGQHNVTIMHQVMQGTYIQLPCKSSLWPCNHHSNVCMPGITYLHNILSSSL